MLKNILKELSATNTKLVAVSKTKPVEQIRSMYDQGQIVFGENRTQELADKYKALPKEIEWHFIGQLQRNKVKYISPFVHLIHSIDSSRLLKEVNKQAKKAKRIIPVLLQFKIAEEDSKAGFDLNTAREMLDGEEYNSWDNIIVHGVMGMATFTDDQTQVRAEFKKLRETFNILKENYFKEQPNFEEISMGMSGDYKIAIEEGSTMVRIGSLLFGARN